MIHEHPTLDAFLTVLQRLNVSGSPPQLISAILQEWTFDPAEFGAIVFPGRARRVRSSLLRASGLTLAADYWRPGAKTPVHDHGDGVCYTMVLSGRLTFDDYAILERRGTRTARLAFTGSHTLGYGKVDVRASSMDLYRIRVGDAPAVSLHLHAGPPGPMTVYDPASGRVRSGPVATDPIGAPRFAEHPAGPVLRR